MEEKEFYEKEELEKSLDKVKEDVELLEKYEKLLDKIEELKGM